MRILLISNLYPDSTNKTRGLYVKKVVDNLRKTSDIELDLTLYFPAKDKLLKFFRFISFHLRIFWYGVLFSKKFDLIYVHFATHSTIMLVLFQSLIRTKIVLNVHGGDVISNTKNTSILNIVAKKAARLCDIIIAPSNYFREVVADTFQVPKGKIFVSPSGGIDRKLFQPLINQDSTEPFTISYISRFIPEKGWEVLCKAIHIIETSKREINCYFCGSGDHRYIKTLIKKYNLSSVKLVEDPSHLEFVKILHGSKVFAFPTMMKESLGLVAIEALSTGIPVIASEIGAIPEYVIKGKNGTLFPPGDEVELANQLIKMMDNPKYLNNLKNSTVQSTEEFDQCNVCESLRKLFIVTINKD